MRNLKKALALALASVMLMGMMVVGTSAASFTDVDDSHNVEAIEVLKTVGVMIGDGDKFNPDKAVSRNEMAVIMTNLLQLETADYSGTTPFTDVPAWAEPFVAACYANGIVTGTSATTFGGDAGVTATQAALMVMKALGYFQYASDFGSDWQLATVKQADKIDLFDGINAKVTATLTRSEAAQLVLNALKATMVEAQGQDGIKVEGEGFTVVTGSTVSYDIVTKVADTKWDDIDATQDNSRDIIQLGEKLFEGKLALNSTTGTDDFGRPADVWTYTDKGETTTITASYAADYSVVVSADKLDTLGEILDKYDLELAPNTTATNFKGTYAYNGNVTTVTANTTSMDTVIAAVDSAINTGTFDNGAVVELFLNDDDKVEDIVVYKYALAKISKIAKAAEDADYDYLVTFKTIADSAFGSYKDTKVAGFDADEFAKDDVVVVVKKDGTDLLSIAKAEAVTGKMTAKGTGYVKVDGVEKKTSYGFTAGTDYANEFTYYLDPNGFVMGSKQTTDVREAVNYLYLSNIEIYKDKSDTIKDNKAPYGVAKVVMMDGTEQIVDLYVKKWTSNADMTSADGEGSMENIQKNDWYYAGVDGKYYEIAAGTNGASDDTAVGTFTTGAFYAYEIKDGMYVLNNLSTLNADTDVKTTAAEAQSTDTGYKLKVIEGKAAVSKDGSGFAAADGTANSKTVLTVVDTTEDKAAVFTGIKNFETATYTIGTNATAALIEKDDDTGIITNIYVVGASAAVIDANWAYLVEAGDTTADGTAYKYYVDGKEVSYIVNGGSTAKGLQDITLTDDEVTANGSGSVAYGTITSVDEDYFTTAGGTYYFADEYAIYNISGDFTGETTEIAKNDVVAIGYTVVNYENKVEVIYVIDAPEVKEIKVGATQGAASTTGIEFVQVGNEITVSGAYTDGDYMFISFANGTWTWLNTQLNVDTDAKQTYTTGTRADGTSFAGIVLTFDYSSMAH